MTREELDSDYFEGTITTGSNQTLEVSTSRADDVVVLMDDGTTDNTPPTYDMTQRVKMDEPDDYQLYDIVTGETARSWFDFGFGQSMQFEFNNQSGSDANYRITVKSYRGRD